MGENRTATWLGMTRCMDACCLTTLMRWSNICLAHSKAACSAAKMTQHELICVLNMIKGCFSTVTAPTRHRDKAVVGACNMLTDGRGDACEAFQERKELSICVPQGLPLGNQRRHEDAQQTWLSQLTAHQLSQGAECIIQDAQIFAPVCCTGVGKGLEDDLQADMNLHGMSSHCNHPCTILLEHMYMLLHLNAAYVS